MIFYYFLYFLRYLLNDEAMHNEAEKMQADEIRQKMFLGANKWFSNLVFRISASVLSLFFFGTKWIFLIFKFYYRIGSWRNVQVRYLWISLISLSHKIIWCLNELKIVSFFEVALVWTGWRDFRRTITKIIVNN